MKWIFCGLLGLMVSAFTGIALGESQDFAAGKTVYDENCAHCHGYEGDGQGYAFENVFPKPRDFTSGMFKIRTTETGEEPTQKDLFQIISRGMPGSTMPEWESVLNEQQLHAVAAYVEQFYKTDEDTEEEEETDEDTEEEE